jgi:hypothetical protein
MIRSKPVVLGAAAMVSLSVFAAANSAMAQTNVANHHIKCDTLYGTMKSNPGLRFGGMSPVAVSVRGTLDGCADQDDLTLTILPSKFSAKLAGPANDCSVFLNLVPPYSAPLPLTGNLVVKWKAAAPGITPTTSILAVTSSTGSDYLPGFGFPGPGHYFQLSIGWSGVTGAFTGFDAGTGSGSSIVAVISSDVLALSNACGSPSPSLRIINLGLGRLDLR